MRLKGAMARRSTLALACGILVACGGGESVTRVSGAVINQDGAYIASAPVVLMDRQTNATFRTQTDTEGRYSLNLPNGHYDAIASDNDSHDVQGVSLVSLGGGEQALDFSLPDTQGNDSMMVGGRIVGRDGQAATDLVVRLRSNMSSGDIEPSLSLSTRTDGNGRFSFDAVEGARSFDLEVLDEVSGFEEHMDFPKASGAVDLVIRLGEVATHNVSRHDRLTVAPSSASVAPAAAALDQPYNFTNQVSLGDRDYANPYDNADETFDVDYACQEKITDAAGKPLLQVRDNYNIRGYCRGELSGGLLNDGFDDRRTLALADGLPLKKVAAIMGIDDKDGRLNVQVANNVGWSGRGLIYMRNRYDAVEAGEQLAQTCTAVQVELEDGSVYNHAGWSTNDFIASTAISLSKGSFLGFGGDDGGQAMKRITTTCYFDQPVSEGQ